MDTLRDTVWDVVISGTGLKQSLLALSLSRSGKKVLHIDRNTHYGGDEAALSLQEAHSWAQQHADTNDASFSNAKVSRGEDAKKELGQPRSYSLALAPQLIFTCSTILAALVSTKAHGQLEFQAVGSWFVIDDGKLVRVPNGREDIFQDSTFDLRAKRSLMRFIRYISDPEAGTNLSEATNRMTVPSYLEDKFGIQASAHAPIMALTLSPDSAENTTIEAALPNVVRHLQSIGLFGPGFAALTPKWGGLAEIAQVACRAGAVGGGVYVLGRGINAIDTTDEAVTVTLSDDETVKATWLVGEAKDLKLPGTPSKTWSRSIHVVADPLSDLFPPTAEGGVTPAGAVIAIPATSSDKLPVYIFVHSSETGECPAGQCVLYASIASSDDTALTILQQAVCDMLGNLSVDQSSILWSMSFHQTGSAVDSVSIPDNLIVVKNNGYELALEDTLLDEVRSIWQKITMEDVEAFMRFEAREGAEDEDTDDQ